MAISMKNRFRNVFEPLALIFAVAVIEQVFAGSCTISQHKFKNDTIQVNTECKVSCYDTTFFAGSNAMCILKHKGYGYLFTILTGMCSNGACEETEDGEIYKRELKEPLWDIYNPQDRIPWDSNCRFINLQDKDENVFLSATCSVNCDGVVKKRTDGTPCVSSQVDSGYDNVNIAVGKCDNGHCVSCGENYQIEVKKDLVQSGYEKNP